MPGALEVLLPLPSQSAFCSQYDGTLLSACRRKSWHIWVQVFKALRSGNAEIEESRQGARTGGPLLGEVLVDSVRVT